MPLKIDLRIIYACVYFIVALYIFIKNMKDKRNILLALLSFCLGSWVLSQLFLSTSYTYVSTMVWAKLTFFFGGSIAFVFFLFSLVFPTIHPLWNKNKLVVFITSPCVIVLGLVLLSELMITDINPQSQTLGGKAEIGPLFTYGALIVVSYMIAGVFLLNQRLKWESGRERMQILYLNISLGIWFLFFAFFGILLPILGNKTFVSLSPLLSIIFILGFAYALIKYRLLDIEFVIKRTSLYLLMVGVITGLYSFVLILPQRVFGNIDGTGSIVLMMVAAMILAFTIEPLRDWLDGITDRMFFQKKYDYYLVLEKVSRELNSVLKLEEVLGVVARSLIQEMHLRSVAVYLREKVGVGIYACYKREGDTPTNMPEQVDEANPLVDYLAENKDIIESGEFRHRFGHLYQEGNVIDPVKAEIQRFIDSEFGGGLIIPMVLKKTVIGFMVLGEKRSQNLFTYRDLALLETLSAQMATALENIQLYEQMLNNERLTIIGTMSAGIAHEIRNPLASIKTFIQMLPEKYDRPEFRKRFNEIVPSEIERLSGITADLLAFSKPSSPSLELISLAQIIDRIISLLSNQIRKKRMIIKKDISHIHDFQADPQQIFQVFLNIILNGIQASQPESEIRIFAEIKDHFQASKGSRGEYVLISISDQGSGIKRKDLAYIFQPFFTTKSEGTGLGLATCKRIVEAHRGEILVDSEENKGTTFTVILPLTLTPESIAIL